MPASPLRRAHQAPDTLPPAQWEIEVPATLHLGAPALPLGNADDADWLRRWEAGSEAAEGGRRRAGEAPPLRMALRQQPAAKRQRGGGEEIYY